MVSFVLGGFGWLAGVLLQLQAGKVAGPFAIAAAAVAAAAFGAAARRRLAGRRLVRGAVVGALAVTLGWAWASAWAALRLADALSPALEGRDLVVDGVVASLPQAVPNGWRFTFDVDTAQTDDGPVEVPRRLALGWYSGFGEPDPANPLPDLRAGDAWRLTVRLRRPHGLRNPHGGDVELMWFEQGVRATGTVRAASRPRPERLAPARCCVVARARQQVRDAIVAAVDSPRAAGVLAALAVGDQSAIAREDWQVFRDAGVAHLMAISGVHVAMFGWLAARLLRAGWARWPSTVLRMPAPMGATVGGVLAAAAYAVFAGWGVPAQRTVWMLAAVAVLRVAGVRWPPWAVLLFAAVVVTAADPWALLQAGFWLSFAAVALLTSSGAPVRDVATDDCGPLRTVAGWLGGGLRAQAVATVGLAPLTLVLFQQVSVVGFGANLVAIPVVTLLATPLALVGVLFTPAWWAGAWVVQHLTDALAWAGAWPAAVWTAAAAPPAVQAAALLGGALAVMPLPWRLRALAATLLLPLLAPAIARPPPGRFEVLAADVGQGTAVLVRTASHLLVYDTGPQYHRDANAGERVLLPLLRARGEARVHRLVLSHRDTDHVGGAEPLLQGLPVDTLLASLEPGHRLLGRATQDVRCEAGQQWVWDGVTFTVLHPPASDHDRPLKPNARSCVVRVDGAGGSVLLAGDIERAQEARLVADGARLRSDVLLVPHHGSRTSSTAPFLDAVAPQVAVIQAGHLNRFGHPVAEVLDRLKARGVAVIDTPSCGAWHWTGNGSPRDGVCVRSVTRRYWHHPGATPPDQ